MSGSTWASPFARGLGHSQQARHGQTGIRLRILYWFSGTTGIS
jgi:hypothetical protein